MLKLIKFQAWTSFGYNGTSGAAMAEARLAATGTNWHTVKLAFNGNQIAVFCDGNPVINVTDVEAAALLERGDQWGYVDGSSRIYNVNR